MRSNLTLSRSCLAFTLCVAGFGCAPLDEPVDSAAQPLQAETSPTEGVRLLYRGYLKHPDLTLASYAVGYSLGTGLDGSTPVPGGGGCTSEMIGPNVFMTAAHCGFADDRVLRFTYVTNFGAPDSQNRATVRSLQWPTSCKRLVQSFQDPVTSSDLSLYYCPNNAEGLGPGDVFGWLDFDGAEVQAGQQVASVFTTASGAMATTTPFTAPTLPFMTPQYGFGSVLLNARQWCSSTDPPVAVNMPGEPGNSGSVMLNTSSWRVAVGPLSVFGGSSCGSPTNARWARSMSGYLAASRVRSDATPPHVATANISDLGLVAARYASAAPGTLLDGDGDRVFDIQRDIEWSRRENQRDWTFLSFGSARQNALWTRDATVTFLPDLGAGAARVQHTVGGYRKLLRHTRLRLVVGATYRLSISTNTTAQGGANPLSFGFCNMIGGVCNYTAARFLPTQPGQSQTFTVSGSTLANATDVYLDIDAHAAWQGTLHAVSVIRTNEAPGSSTHAALMDFDTHDTRVNWRNAISGARAVIIPDGKTATPGAFVAYADGFVTTPLAPDWALYVSRDPNAPMGWVARNQQLALVTGHRYSLCFDHRRLNTTASTGVLRVQSWNGSSWVNSLSDLPFTPASGWQTTCTGTFTALGDASSLQFGFGGALATGQHYLIDDLRIVEQP